MPDHVAPIDNAQAAARRERQALVAILLLGLMLRIVFLAMNAQSPDFDSPILDPQLNDYWARALAAGNWAPPQHADDPQLRESPYGRPPGYPYLLAAIYYASNGAYLAPRVVQAMVGLLNILLVYWLGKRLLGGASGLAAALFMAIYWAAVYFEGELNSPTWEVFVALIMASLLVRWSETRRGSLLALAGAFLGVGALMRPNVLLTGGAVGLWLLWDARRKDRRFRTAWMRCLVFGCACLAVIAPAIVRNWRVSGDFILISYYGGVNAYIGNNPESRGVSPRIPDLYELSGMDAWNCFNYRLVVAGLGKHLNRPDFDYADASRYFYRRALRYWRESPLDALRLTLRKAWLFWGPHEVSDSKVIHYERAHSPLLARLPGFSVLLALALVGLFMTRGNTKQDVHSSGISLFLLYIAAYFLSVLPFFIAGRYRFPVAPFLMPFAGYALARTLRAMRQGMYPMGVALILVMTAAWFVVSWPMVDYTPHRSTWHCHRGIAHAARNRLVQAEEELRAAVSAEPRNDEAHVQLGYVYARMDQSDKAMVHYQAAVEANPNNVYGLNNLGYEHFKRGNPAKAEALYRRAVLHTPAFTLAWNNLGNALLEQNQMEEAVAAYEEALRVNPGDPHAHYNIGNAYMGRQRYDEAVEQYRLALETSPWNPNVPNNLGLALARSGRLEASIEWFEKALTLAPDHLLAHFNLGNVYGDLGRVEDARRHFERCLEIAPDYQEARERLERLDKQSGGRPIRTMNEENGAETAPSDPV